MGFFWGLRHMPFCPKTMLLGLLSWNMRYPVRPNLGRGRGWHQGSLARSQCAWACQWVGAAHISIHSATVAGALAGEQQIKHSL